MVTEGCIHGCFQPFQNAHLAHVHEAFGHAAFLWIGLAQPFPVESTLAPPPESLLPIANPLTYFERQFMITRTLIGEGIDPERFAFTPFPITAPQLLPQYLDLEITCILTADDDWNRRKQSALRELGYPVDLLARPAHPTDAATLCTAIRDGDHSWRNLVPTSTESFLDEIDLASRLHQISP